MHEVSRNQMAYSTLDRHGLQNALFVTLPTDLRDNEANFDRIIMLISCLVARTSRYGEFCTDDNRKFLYCLHAC